MKRVLVLSLLVLCLAMTGMNAQASIINELNDQFGLHWTMQCGNDVIEGAGSSSPVPAPPALVLLVSGLAALGLFRRFQADGKTS